MNLPRYSVSLHGDPRLCSQRAGSEVMSAHPTTMLSKMTAQMMAPSMWSLMANDRIAVITRTRVRELETCLSRIVQSDIPLAPSTLLGPFCRRRAAASAPVRPFLVAACQSTLDSRASTPEFVTCTCGGKWALRSLDVSVEKSTDLACPEDVGGISRELCNRRGLCADGRFVRIGFGRLY